MQEVDRMTVAESRRKAGMSRRELADWLDIPYQTVTNWELGKSKCPEYVEKLIVEKIMSSFPGKVTVSKYALVQNKGEFRQGDIHEGCTLELSGQKPKVLAEYDEKEKALEELESHKGSAEKLSTPIGTKYVVTEYYVEEKVWDETGKCVGSAKVLKFAPMQDLND